MNWIRVDVGIASDPKLHQFAKALKVKRPEAVGLFVSALCQFPDHARDGNVELIDAETLAEWAGWRGKPDAFAAAFRRVFCDGTGTVAGWQKHNGAALRDAERNAKNAREYRNRKRQSNGDVGGDVHGDVTAYERDETNETRRDAVAVPCDSKKQLAVQRSTPYSARGRGGLTRIGTEIDRDWSELMRKADGRIA
jgi:hypothetical protein